MKLRDLGEDALIRRLRQRFASNVQVGIGDDAAIFDFPTGYSAVYCSDLLVETTHFLRDLHPADSVGFKSIAVNVSDVGAMGGVPMHFLISIAAPGDLDLSWIDAFYDGIETASHDFNVSLLGGDSSSAERIFVDVSMIGRVPANSAVRRSGAKAGDRIYVTGHLGQSVLGLETLRTGLRTGPAVQRHLYPTPRHQVGAAVRQRAHAMIDISDGLSTDLMHILEESNVSARIYKDRLPVCTGASDLQALHGGEEYELIIVAPELPSSIEGVPLTLIGEIIHPSPYHQLFLIDGMNESVLHPKGWQHFV